MLQILLYMILQCCQKSQTILSAADTRNHKLRLVLFWGVFGHTNLVAELQEQVSGRFSSKKPPNLRGRKREIP